MTSDLLGAGDHGRARVSTERLDQVVPALRFGLRPCLGRNLLHLLPRLLLVLGVRCCLVRICEFQVLTRVALVVELCLGQPLLLCQCIVGGGLAAARLSTLSLL